VEFKQAGLVWQNLWHFNELCERYPTRNGNLRFLIRVCDVLRFIVGGTLRGLWPQVFPAPRERRGMSYSSISLSTRDD
jgi:hypothetical protein